jgi:fatty acid desaturase
MYNYIVNYNNKLIKDDNWIVKEIYNKIDTSKQQNNNYFYILNIITNNINNKLERQLFPNINSEYYDEISKIIVKYCYDNNIKYSMDYIISPTSSIDMVNKYL